MMLERMGEPMLLVFASSEGNQCPEREIRFGADALIVGLRAAGPDGPARAAGVELTVDARPVLGVDRMGARVGFERPLFVYAGTPITFEVGEGRVDLLGFYVAPSWQAEAIARAGQEQVFGRERASGDWPAEPHREDLTGSRSNVASMQDYLQRERAEQQAQLRKEGLNVDLAMLEALSAGSELLRALEGDGPVPKTVQAAFRLSLQQYAAASDAYLEKHLEVARKRGGGK